MNFLLPLDIWFQIPSDRPNWNMAYSLMIAGIGFARRCNSNLAHTASSGAASGLPARRAAA